VKFTTVLAAVLIAVVLQVTFARYTVGGRWAFDLVLVGVVYAALRWEAVAGMVAGTLGGLLQDMLSGGIIGVGGLAKTLTGFATGVVGTQFVVAKPHARAIIVGGATIFHRLIMLVLQGLIDQKWPGLPWTAMLGETAINSVCGFLAFHLTDALPGAIGRGRMSRRSGLGRRQW
jgi:rod shape-determining protein MreD